MSNHLKISLVSRILIRTLDIFLSVAALFILSPLFLILTLMLRFSGQGEVLYFQERIGLGGKKIRLIKFATMLRNSPEMGAGELTLPQDPRVLPMGGVLRKTKLNELPQLINILKGDLSLIGPRPQTQKFYLCYREEDRALISLVRPGLSGVGSILFRNEEDLIASAHDPVAFDADVLMPYKGELESWYVVNQSLGLYFELILISILVVLFPSCRFHQGIMSRLPSPPHQLINLVL